VHCARRDLTARGALVLSCMGTCTVLPACAGAARTDPVVVHMCVDARADACTLTGHCMRSNHDTARCMRAHPHASVRHVATRPPCVRAGPAYVFGAARSNACPTGATRIDTASACQSAATATGQTWRWSETISTYPKGCYAFTGTGYSLGIYFNPTTTGAGVLDARLLCAGAPRLRHGRPVGRSAWVPWDY
jgi:hypothetical protein